MIASAQQKAKRIKQTMSMKFPLQLLCKIIHAQVANICD